MVWECPVAELSYDADRLANGSTLISVQARITEVAPTGATVWSYPAIYETEVIEGYLVTTPNGRQLWAKIIQPRVDLYPDESFPAVISATAPRITTGLFTRTISRRSASLLTPAPT